MSNCLLTADEKIKKAFTERNLEPGRTELTYKQTQVAPFRDLDLKDYIEVAVQCFSRSRVGISGRPEEKKSDAGLNRAELAMLQMLSKKQNSLNPHGNNLSKLSVSKVRSSNLKNAKRMQRLNKKARAEVFIQDTSNICAVHQKLGNEARCNDESCMFRKIRLCFKHHKFGLNAFYCEGDCEWNTYVKSEQRN